jgi:hypothetical protein
MAKKKQTPKESPRDAVVRLSASWVGNDAQKDEIRALIASEGLEITINEHCPNCWTDALAQLRHRYGVKAADVKPEQKKGVVRWL